MNIARMMPGAAKRKTSRAAKKEPPCKAPALAQLAANGEPQQIQEIRRETPRRVETPKFSGPIDLVAAKRDLVQALSLCLRVSDRKSTLPVLSHVLLETRGSGLSVAATDLTVALRRVLPADVMARGAIAVDARELLRRIKALTEPSVTVSSSNDFAISVRGLGGERRYTLHGMPADKFPSLPEPETSAVYELDARAMGALIERTHFAISTDDSRANLTGALLGWNGQEVRMVTTDGHRLCKMEVRHGATELDGDGDGDGAMLILLKGVQELRRLCGELRPGVKLEILSAGTHAFFRSPSFQLSVKLIDAEFPPYEKVIPRRSEHCALAARADMIQAMKAVCIAASDRTGGVRLTLEDGALRFESESPESGSASDKMSADYDGPRVAVGLNAQYVLDALGAMTAKEVCLSVAGDIAPAMLWPATAEPDGEYLAVIMPMRI